MKTIWEKERIKRDRLESKNVLHSTLHNKQINNNNICIWVCLVLKQVFMIKQIKEGERE